MLKDLIQKTIIVLSLEYLVFFSAGVILPGVIANAFNINILLLSILSLIGLLIIVPNVKSNKDSKKSSHQKVTRYDKKFLLLGGILLFVNAIALYKVSIVMMGIYTIIIIVSARLLWNNKLIFK